MKLWDDAKRQKAQKLLDFICSSNLMAGPNRELSLAVREFCYLSPHERLRQLGDDSLYGFPIGITNVLGPSITTLEDFERSFDNYLQSRSKKNDSRQWKFYLPLYLEREDDVPRPTRIRVLDIDFWISSLPSVLRQVARDDFMNRATMERIAGRVRKVDAPELYLVMNSQGYSWRAAWEHVSPAFDTLRGLIEFTFGFRGWLYSPLQQPRGKVQHPPWVAIQCLDKVDKLEFEDFLVEPYYQVPLFALTEPRFSSLKRNAKIFHTAPSEKSTLALIGNCLRLYVQAMDARPTHHCLTGLWQLAELITLAEDSGGKTDVVVNRLAWHTSKLKPGGVEFNEILRLLAAKRNDIVHRGIHNVGNEDVNTLKLMCEMAMEWLFRVRLK